MRTVFEKHGEEIKMYELSAGKLKGRLMFAMAILSDVRNLLANQQEALCEEIDEVKELIGSVIGSLGVYGKDEKTK